MSLILRRHKGPIEKGMWHASFDDNKRHHLASQQKIGTRAGQNLSPDAKVRSSLSPYQLAPIRKLGCCASKNRNGAQDI